MVDETLLKKNHPSKSALLRQMNKGYGHCKSCGAHTHKSQLVNGKCRECHDSESPMVVIIKVDRDQFAAVVNWWVL